MGNKIRINKRFFILLILGIVFCGVCMGRAGMTVRAEGQTFIIDAEMLPSAESAYEIRLTVENQGQDWEGTVRLMMTTVYGSLADCAYDTELALPRGSTKQFVVRVPKDSLERTDGVVQVILLDKKGDEAARKEFKRLLQAEVDALTMGILSDRYRALSYLDMGGEEFYHNGRNYPIKLEELDPDKLEDSLDALHFLVIDSYNTGVLSEQILENIRQWMDDGGMMIIGTGSSAEEALAGFADLEIQCAGVYEPGTGPDVYSDSVDVSQLPMAELTDVSGNYKEGYDVLGLVCSQGNGAVEILPYSLAEVEKRNAAGNYEKQKYFVARILSQVDGYANTYGSGQSDSNNDSMRFLTNLCNSFGNANNRLQFGWLKLIVVLYVIFVGPVLYLILRFIRKRDLYWVAVPVTTLAGVLLVYFAGRGFEVVDTNVYSVTVENLNGGGNARTYLHCYDAGHKEWALRLAEGYEYAGPLKESYYLRGDENYYYHIRKEGDRLFFGMNPSMGFEDGYFQAGIVREPEEGSIHGDVQMTGLRSISGTVANGTERDFKYFAVSNGADMFVYEDLPAGMAVKLDEAEAVYNNDGGSYNGMAGYCYSFIRDARRGEMAEDADILTALGMGIFSAYSVEAPNATVIVGVTEDWDKAVDDNCSEVSYRCLYMVQ